MAAITSAIVGGLALGYSAYSGEKARSDAKDAKREQAAQLKEQEEALQLKERSEDEQSKAIAARDAQKTKLFKAIQGNRGRTGTMNDVGGTPGPVGLIGAQKSGRTLIGL